MNSSQQQFAQQWQTYLQQVAANVNQILAETDAGCRQMIASRPTDTQAFDNAVQAIHVKMQTIKTEAMNALAQQNMQLATSGNGGPLLAEIERGSKGLVQWIDETWLRFRAQKRTESMRALWTGVQEAMRRPVACTKCGGAIEPRLRHAADTVECKHCHAVNQTTPDPAVQTYFALAPIVFAEAAALEKRLAIDRFRADVDARRRASMPALAFAAPVQVKQYGPGGVVQSAVVAGQAIDEEPLDSMMQWEAMERDYWTTYFATSSQVLPSPPEEQAKMVESRMKPLIDQHFKMHKGWCKARGIEGPVENARTPEMMSGPDDYGPFRPDQVEDFYYTAYMLDDSRNDAPRFRELLAKFGYRDNTQFERVRLTFNRHVDPATVMNLAQVQLNARNRASRDQMAAKEAGAGELLAPIEGVTIEQYAALAAQAARNLPPAEYQRLLAQHQLDQAKFDRVSKAWTARMSQDTTFALMNIYSKAFGSAGAGQYGAAGQAGVAEAAGGAPAFNPATVSFETYCEIMGAQAAWSSQGKDVNAMLKKVFNMTALDYSNVSQYWSPKMMTDMSLAMKMSDLMMRAQQKHMAT
jgi:ribosomal protein L37AE/L43A